MARQTNNGDNNARVKLVATGIVIAIAVVLSCFGVRFGGKGSAGSSTASPSSSAVVQTMTSTSDTSSDSAAGSLCDAPASQVSAAKSGNLTFRYDDRLQEHFEKHGAELGYQSAEDYLAGANAVVANDAALHKNESEDGDDVYFLESTGELVVVSTKGYIRTYFSADRDYFDRQ